MSKAFVTLFATAIFATLPLSTAWAESDNETCLACHGNPTITGKKVANPFIDPEQFARTSHSGVGCAACHEGVSELHPDAGGPVKRAGCQDCHAEVQEVYDKSIHGSNATCGDCHNPHTVRPASAVSGFDIISQCTKCHESTQVSATHGKWLPQTDLHLKSVPCLSCHTESSEFAVTLFLQKRDAAKNEYNLMTNYELGRTLPPGVPAGQWLDLDKDGTISLKELRDFNLRGRPSDVRLFGVMMPEKVDHNFKLLLNRRDCSFCHVSGPEVRQTSYVAFPERDGSYTRVAVEKGAVLDALFGTPDFYMVGSTRSPILSLLGLAIIAGGIAFPVLHGTFRYKTRKNRQKKSH